MTANVQAPTDTDDRGLKSAKYVLRISRDVPDLGRSD